MRLAGFRRRSKPRCVGCGVQRSVIIAALDTDRASATALDGIAMVAIAAIRVGVAVSDITAHLVIAAPSTDPAETATCLGVAVAALVAACGGEATLDVGANCATVSVCAGGRGKHRQRSRAKHNSHQKPLFHRHPPIG